MSSVVEQLSPSWVEACAALAAEREDDPVERWLPVFRQRAAAEPATTFVARVDGRLAGYASMGWLSPEQAGGTAPDGWYLTGLVISPQWRRHGIGTALTRHRLKVLSGIASEVYYFASTLNRPTIELHAKLGFREHATDIRIQGVTFTGGTGRLFRLLLRDDGLPTDTVG